MAGFDFSLMFTLFAKILLNLFLKFLITVILIKDLLDLLQSCKHENWVGIAKYLLDEVPKIVKSKDFKDFGEVLTVLFTSLPSNFGEFVKWVAEVRRREDGDHSLSQEEKGRLALKVFWSFTFTLFSLFSG